MMREIVFVSIIVICIIWLILIEIGINNIEKRTQARVYVHNRAVRLGLYANEISTDSREDCFVPDSFLRMSNGGTVDVAYLRECPYTNLLNYTAEDLFLGEQNGL